MYVYRFLFRVYEFSIYWKFLGKNEGDKSVDCRDSSLRDRKIERLEWERKLDIILFRDFEILFRDYFLFPRIIQCITSNRDKTILIL